MAGYVRHLLFRPVLSRVLPCLLATAIKFHHVLLLCFSVVVMRRRVTMRSILYAAGLPGAVIVRKPVDVM